MLEPIYLDHNATTPLLPEVVEAMLPFLHTHFGNPSSGHVFGVRAKDAVEEARGRVAALIGCAPEEVFFTSGGTEANNLAIRGVAEATSLRTAAAGRRGCITSVIEHPATTNPCRWLERHGWRVRYVDVDACARVSVDAASAVLAESEDIALVTIMHANNEVGTMQPIRALSDRAHACGAVLHTDAAQSVGKVRVDVDELGVDLLSVAGHKLNAAKGVGALYVRKGTPIAPLVLGAGHEKGLRPGTENVASIVGLGVACDVARRTLATKTRRFAELRDRLGSALARAIPHLAVNAAGADCLPNTLSVRFPRARGSEVLAAAPEVAASTGSACHSGHESASGVLLAMGLSPSDALETVRLSVGTTTTEDEVDRAASALARAWTETARG